MMLLTDTHFNQLAQWLANVANGDESTLETRYMAAQFAEVLDHARRGYPRLMITNGGHRGVGRT